MVLTTVAWRVAWRVVMMVVCLVRKAVAARASEKVATLVVGKGTPTGMMRVVLMVDE